MSRNSGRLRSFGAPQGNRGDADAIHLATACLLRPHAEDLYFATHDGELATAARAVGFKVLGGPSAKRRP